jgi:hypothetical protein
VRIIDPDRVEVLEPHGCRVERPGRAGVAPMQGASQTSDSKSCVARRR